MTAINLLGNGFSKKLFLVFCFILIYTFISIPLSEAEESVVSIRKPDQVILQLKWVHEFNFAGYYAAVEKEFYKEAGLEVTIKEGKPGMDFIDEVVSGRADYGVEMPELLIARNHGKPVVVLAAIFQHSPQIILARADSGIRSPHNLIGKKVMWRFDSAAELRAMLINENVPLEQVEFMELSWNINDLIDGKVDAIHAYITDQPLSLEKVGIESAILSPINYGIDFYGDCLFTSEEEISENPDRARAFREASLRGWAYAMENPEEVMDIIRDKYGTKSTREYMRNEFKHINRLIMPEFVEIGYMNPGRWKHIGDTFLKLGMLEQGYSLNGFLYDPNPEPDNSKVMRIIWIMLGLIAFIFACGIVLLSYNRKLKQEVQERTSHLSTEIAERKKAEELLRLRSEILTNMDEGVILVRLNDSTIVYTNPKFDTMFGYGSGELIGKHIATVNAPSDKSPEETAEEIMEVIRKEGIWKGEVKNIRKDGTTFWTFANVSILDYHEYGKVIVSVQSDISDRRSLEEQLRQSQKMETVGQLAGGLAHDFNNILGAIMNYGYILQNTLDNEEQKELLNHMLYSTNRAAKLTSDLLAFSRKQLIQTNPVKLNEILKRVVKFTSRILGEHIIIKTIFAEKAPIVMVDSTQIEQVLMNLLTNARDAMPEGGILTIETKEIEMDDEYVKTHGYGEPGRYVLVSVTDTGKGMDEEIRMKIFEPFYTTKAVGKGTGLGLSMVYGIIKQHNGYINVYSEPGEGTTFKIYLPITGEEAVETRLSVFKTIARGTETVLLAEDDDDIRDVTKQILEAHGYKVIEAVDGEDAVEKFKENIERIQLLIFDLVMPEKSGKNAYDEIRKERPDIKVLFVSGYPNDIISGKGVLHDGLNFLSKPVAPNDLLKKIREILNG